MSLNFRARAVARAEQFLNSRVLADSELYAGECHTSDAAWILALKNALNPHRLLTQFRYGQVLPLPPPSVGPRVPQLLRPTSIGTRCVASWRRSAPTA